MDVQRCVSYHFVLFRCQCEGLGTLLINGTHNFEMLCTIGVNHVLAQTTFSALPGGVSTKPETVQCTRLPFGFLIRLHRFKDTGTAARVLKFKKRQWQQNRQVHKLASHLISHCIDTTLENNGVLKVPLTSYIKDIIAVIFTQVVRSTSP